MSMDAAAFEHVDVDCITCFSRHRVHPWQRGGAVIGCLRLKSQRRETHFTWDGLYVDGGVDSYSMTSRGLGLSPAKPHIGHRQ